MMTMSSWAGGCPSRRFVSLGLKLPEHLGPQVATSDYHQDRDPDLTPAQPGADR